MKDGPRYEPNDYEPEIREIYSLTNVFTTRLFSNVFKTEPLILIPNTDPPLRAPSVVRGSEAGKMREKRGRPAGRERGRGGAVSYGVWRSLSGDVGAEGTGLFRRGVGFSSVTHKSRQSLDGRL